MSEQPTAERVDVRKELLFLEENPHCHPDTRREIARHAIDLVESLSRERVEPQPLTMLDALCESWKAEPQLLAGMLVKRLCTYDGCESFEMPFKLGYKYTRAEAIKETLIYLGSASEPKGEDA